MSLDKDFFLLDLPIYRPEYKENELYGYSNDNIKKRTRKLLIETSKEYCMYCYNRIVINGNNYGHIEHGVEKYNAKCLENCVMNLGIACSKCNQSYKSCNEKNRKLTPNKIQKLEQCICDSGKCRKPCKAFQQCRKYYVNKWKIILQPFGVENKKKIPYRIQFNLLTGEYIANQHEIYTQEDKEFILSHIDFFGLNEVKRRNKELAIYCKNVMLEHSILKEITVNHLIVELFRERLESIPLEKAIKVCEVVYFSLTQVQNT